MRLIANRWTLVTSSTTIISDYAANDPDHVAPGRDCGLRSHAQDWAKARLDKSPRKHEEVMVQHGGNAIATFIAYPETKDKKPVVVLIHDRSGLDRLGQGPGG